MSFSKPQVKFCITLQCHKTQLILSKQHYFENHSRQHSFENLFAPTAEMTGENYDLLYQNSVRQYEDDLKH